jgi:putative transposase
MHCVCALHVHLAFVTRHRRGVFTREVPDDLRTVFPGVCTNFESELIEFDGEDDHVHLLIHYPPNVSVSTLVNSLQGVSSRMIRSKNYPAIRTLSPPYFAGSCGGAPISILRQYIGQQRTPDSLATGRHSRPCATSPP